MFVLFRRDTKWKTELKKKKGKSMRKPFEANFVVILSNVNIGKTDLT